MKNLKIFNLHEDHQTETPIVWTPVYLYLVLGDEHVLYFCCCELHRMELLDMCIDVYGDDVKYFNVASDYMTSRAGFH